jgi:hypothetical protein
MIRPLKISPQIFRTSTGLRLITHAVWDGKKFVCYGKCFCGAARAVLEVMRNEKRRA